VGPLTDARRDVDTLADLADAVLVGLGSRTGSLIDQETNRLGRFEPITVIGPDFGNVSSVRRLVGSWCAGLFPLIPPPSGEDDGEADGDAPIAVPDIASTVVNAAVAPTTGINRRLAPEDPGERADEIKRTTPE